MEVLDEHEERAHLALPQQEMLNRLPHCLTTLDRLEGVPAGGGERNLEERKEGRPVWRQGRTQFAESRFHAFGDLRGRVRLFDVEASAE
jgi:hypothetical protein